MSGKLWNQTGPNQPPADVGIILEQYKLYVASAEKISDRRALANTFFVSLNSAAFVAIAALWENRPDGHSGWLALPLVAALTVCGAWFYLLRYYRLINRAKFKVVGQLEQRLPASPYWGAEWTELGEGMDYKRYLPLSTIESTVPVIFATIYAAGAVAVWLG